METTPGGRLVVVSGPSGAGKTTVLQRVFRQLPPAAGAQRLGHHPAAAARRNRRRRLPLPHPGGVRSAAAATGEFIECFQVFEEDIGTERCEARWPPAWRRENGSCSTSTSRAPWPSWSSFPTPSRFLSAPARWTNWNAACAAAAPKATQSIRQRLQTGDERIGTGRSIPLPGHQRRHGPGSRGNMHDPDSTMGDTRR